MNRAATGRFLFEQPADPLGLDRQHSPRSRNEQPGVFRQRLTDRGFECRCALFGLAGIGGSIGELRRDGCAFGGNPLRFGPRRGNLLRLFHDAQADPGILDRQFRFAAAGVVLHRVQPGRMILQQNDCFRYGIADRCRRLLDARLENFADSFGLARLFAALPLPLR